MTAIEVVLVGGGRIVSGNQGLGGNVPLSHLAAISAVGPSVANLRGLVEPHAERVAEIRKAWPEFRTVPIVASIAELGSIGGCVGIVCTPESVRLDPVSALIDAGAALVIIEKPLAASTQDAIAVCDRASRASIPLYVNYNRRFDPRITAFGARFQGRMESAVLYYGRGIRNYASHMLDLMVHWFGPVVEAQSLTDGSFALDDHDPSPSFVLRFGNGSMLTAHGHEGLSYDLLDLVITTESAQYTLRVGGAEIWRGEAQLDAFYRGYSHLVQSVESAAPIAGFAEMYRAAHASLVQGEVFAGCSAGTALHLARIIDAVILSGRSGGARIRVD